MLSRIGFGFRLVNCTWRMLRWSIDCVQLECTATCIDKVVLCSSRNKAEAVCCNGLMLVVQDGFTLPGHEDEHLINIVVRFLSNLTARWDTHEYHLTIRASYYLLTEILILLCELDDIVVEIHSRTISFYNCASLQWSCAQHDMRDAPGRQAEAFTESNSVYDEFLTTTKMPSRKLYDEEFPKEVAESRYYRHTLSLSIKTFNLNKEGIMPVSKKKRTTSETW
jgi:hypothetical protein